MWPGAKAGRRVTHRRHGSSRKEMRFPSCGNGARRILQVQKTWLSCKDLAQVLSGGLTVVAYHQDLYSLTHIIVLYFPFKIIIRTYFWGGEAYTLNSLIPSFPYFSYTKPLQAFAFPAFPFLAGIEFDAFGTLVRLTLSPGCQRITQKCLLILDRQWFIYSQSLVYVPWRMWVERKAWVCICRCVACSH